MLAACLSNTFYPPIFIFNCSLTIFLRNFCFYKINESLSNGFWRLWFPYNLHILQALWVCMLFSLLTDSNRLVSMRVPCDCTLTSTNGGRNYLFPNLHSCLTKLRRCSVTKRDRCGILYLRLELTAEFLWSDLNKNKQKL